MRRKASSCLKQAWPSRLLTCSILCFYIVCYVRRAVAGGGRSSARETIGRVAAAAVARKLLHLYCGCEVC
jgi:Chorismate synthase